MFMCVCMCICIYIYIYAILYISVCVSVCVCTSLTISLRGKIPCVSLREPKRPRLPDSTKRPHRSSWENLRGTILSEQCPGASLMRRFALGGGSLQSRLEPSCGEGVELDKCGCGFEAHPEGCDWRSVWQSQTERNIKKLPLKHGLSQILSVPSGTSAQLFHHPPLRSLQTTCLLQV